MKRTELKEFLQNERLNGENLFSSIQNFIAQEYNQQGKVFRRSSPFGMILRVTVGLFQLLFYYLEDSIVESNILTAARPKSVRGLATLSGHNPGRRIASTGVLEFTVVGGDEVFGGKVTIPNRLKLKNNDNGLYYSLQLKSNDVTIDLNEEIDLAFSVIQGEFKDSTFTSNGQKLQSFAVDDTAIEEYHLQIYVDGEAWRISKSFYDMQLDEKACYVRSGFDGGIDVYFGTGDFGKIPRPGSEIRIRYLSTNGVRGEITESENWEFEESGFDTVGEEVNLNDLFRVTVKEEIIFGAEIETLQFTRLIAPKLSKTFSLLTAEDYVNLFKRFNYFSTIQAFTERRRLSEGNVIQLLLVPDLNRRLGEGKNYFHLSENDFILTEYEKRKIQDFIAQRGTQAPNTDIKFLSPVIKRYAMDIVIRAFDDVPRDRITNEIKNKISEYFLNFSRRDYVPSSDFIYLFEKIDGIDSVNVYFISEDNEEQHRQLGTNSGQGLSPIGLDRMNDIIIQGKEIPVIRGGWEDRFGQEYITNFNPDFKAPVETFDIDIIEQEDPLQKGAVTVFFQPSIKRTINTEFVKRQTGRS